MYAIEVWHDTTMWNEGFEQAAEPYVIVKVSSDSDAHALGQWMEETHSLDARNDYYGFTIRRGWADPALPTLSLPHAKQTINDAIANWGGI